MIACKLRHLEARCLQRGYTLDEVRPCVVSQDGESITVDELHPAYPRQQKQPPDLTRADAPSFLQKVKNFASAAARHVAAGAPMASDEEIIRRHDICLACEFLRDGACTKCGCPINRARKYVSKLSWADSECPVGKWGKAPPA